MLMHGIEIAQNIIIIATCMPDFDSLPACTVIDRDALGIIYGILYCGIISNCFRISMSHCHSIDSGVVSIFLY